MKINLIELEEAVMSLLSKLRESKGNEIELSSDFYWDIPQNEMYDPYKEPRNITLGQLSDDLTEIQRLKTEDSAIAYDIKRVASILNAISSENATSF